MTVREFRATVSALFPRGVPSYRHLDAVHPAFLDPVGAVSAAAGVTGGAVVAAVATPSVQMVADMVYMQSAPSPPMNWLEFLSALAPLTALAFPGAAPESDLQPAMAERMVTADARAAAGAAFAANRRSSGRRDGDGDGDGDGNGDGDEGRRGGGGEGGGGGGAAAFDAKDPAAHRAAAAAAVSPWPAAVKPTARQLAALEASLAAKEAAYGAIHVEVACTLDALSAAETARGRTSEAAEYAERALVTYEQSLGPETPEVAAALATAATAALATGRATAAKPWAERAISLQSAFLGAEHPDVNVRLPRLLADCHAAAGRAVYAHYTHLYETSVKKYYVLTEVKIRVLTGGYR